MDLDFESFEVSRVVVVVVPIASSSGLQASFLVVLTFTGFGVLWRVMREETCLPVAVKDSTEQCRVNYLFSCVVY